MSPFTNSMSSSHEKALFEALLSVITTPSAQYLLLQAPNLTEDI